jgi:hypothetical protein
MADKPTEHKIEDQKVEVTLLPLAKPLPEDELNRRITDLVNNIRISGCGGLARNNAQGIADAEYGGRVQNVQTAFPQLMMDAANGTRILNAQLWREGNRTLDKDGRAVLNGNDLTAVTLAAGKWLADHPGTKPAEVPLNDEFLKDYKLGLSVLAEPPPNKCTVHGTPIFPGKSGISNSPKGR